LKKRLITGLCGYAMLWAPPSWADLDPHFGLDFANEIEVEEPETDFSAAPPADQTPLIIPTVAQKPAVPFLFSAATEKVRAWKNVETLAPPPPPVPVPQRQLSSAPVPSPTLSLMEKELETEARFQEEVKEASVVDSSSTYRSILRALSDGKVAPHALAH
jgi:hypothetical protein